MIEEVLRAMHNDEFIRTILGILSGVMAGYLLVFRYFMDYMKSERTGRRDKRERFLDALSGALRAGNLESVEDAKNLYEGAMGQSAAESERGLALSQLLKEYLVRLQMDEIERPPEEKGQENPSEWTPTVTTLLRRLEEASPFDALPEAERSVVADLDEFLDADNTAAARRKLEQLSGMIQARTQDIEVLERTNKWSVPLAIVGVVLTLFFGVLSLISW